MIPSPAVVIPKLNLTANAPVRLNENEIAPQSPALPQFNIGSKVLPSRARRGRTYYKPTTKTFIHYSASQRNNNNNLTADTSETEFSSLRAKLLQQCKPFLMNTEPVPDIYRTLPGTRVLGTNQTNSRLILQQQEVAIDAVAKTAVASIKASASDLALPSITNKKSVTFDSMTTPAVPKVRLARTQTPAAAAATPMPFASSPSFSSVEPNSYDIDGPYIFGSDEALPSPAPLTHTFLFIPDDYGTTEPSNTDLTKAFEPKPTITLEKRDYNAKKINISQFTTDDDIEVEAAGNNQDPSEAEPKKSKTDVGGWGALPNMQKYTDNKWKCKICLGSVSNSLTVCGSCETPRFPGNDTATVSTQVKTSVADTGGFSFGGAPATAPPPASTAGAPTTTGVFTFSAAATTAPAPATTSKFTFGAAPSAAAAYPASTNPGFTFQAPPASASATTTTSGFTFGVTSTAATAETPAAAGSVFGGATPAKVIAADFTATPIEESKSTTPQFPVNFGTTAPQTEPKKKRSAVFVPEAPKTEVKPLDGPGFKFGTAPNSFPPPMFSSASTKEMHNQQTKKRRSTDDKDQDDASQTDSALTSAGSAPVAFSFASTSAPAFGSTLAESGTTTPAFNFGASAVAAPAPVGGKPSFSFGAPVPAAAEPVSVGGAPSLIVGASATPAPAPIVGGPSFSFGASTAPTPVGGGPSLSFGASTAAPAPAPVGGGPSFSFGASTATAAPAPAGGGPSFSFGASTAPAGPSFSFGASTAAPAPIGGGPGFSFGAAPAPAGGGPSFSFGAPAAAPSAPSIGGAPNFSFGAPAAAPAAPVGGASSFVFSSQPPSSAPSPVPTAAAGSFGGPPTAPSFGGIPGGFGRGSFGVAPTTSAAPPPVSFGFGGGTPAAASFGGFPPAGGFGGPSTPAANFGTPQAPGGFSIGTGGSTRGSTRGGRRFIKAKRPPGTQ